MFEMIPIDDDSRAGQSLMRPSELMQRLGVSRSWLYQAAKDGRIPSVRLGGPDGPVRFVADDIEAWIENARAGWRPTDSAARALRRTAAAGSRGRHGGDPDQLRLAAQ
jgi:excisionase family DNA binding protein